MSADLRDERQAYHTSSALRSTGRLDISKTQSQLPRSLFSFLIRRLQPVFHRLNSRFRAWLRRRQGQDSNPVTLASRRIYILPTGLGLGFAGMLLLMSLGAMNYANNLALGLAFLLASVALVAMHHCHRTLVGLSVSGSALEPVFAGQQARFGITLINEARETRPEIELTSDGPALAPVRLQAATHELIRTVVELTVPTQHRGRARLERFEVASRYPFGLFRAWAVVHMHLECIVYPKPTDGTLPPLPQQTDMGGPQEALQGEEEFAGLRPFHSGDSPRRIAWKAYARGQGLHIKQYAGTAVTSHLFTWDSLEGLGTEARLSQLCRWIIDAHAAGRPYGLKIPSVSIEVNVGDPHRQRCLTALALFQE